jgi:hypothetical protein
VADEAGNTTARAVGSPWIYPWGAITYASGNLLSTMLQTGV